MQGCGSPRRTSLPLMMSTPEEPLQIGTSVLTNALPIIGPPPITFTSPSGRPPHASMSCVIGVPIRVRKLLGCLSSLPVTVTMRSKSGLFFITASYTAKAVPTFWMMAPTDTGSAGGAGTWRRTTASISCFSPPWGYLVFRGTTSILGCWAAHFSVISLIASGLFSSMPIKPLVTLAAFMSSSTPTSTSSAFSSIRRWSAVRYGSHSTALMMTHSGLNCGGGMSFTWVGKQAPPIPTMPAFFTFSIISSGVSSGLSAKVTSLSLRSMDSSHSSPSTVI